MCSTYTLCEQCLTIINMRHVQCDHGHDAWTVLEGIFYRYDMVFLPQRTLSSSETNTIWQNLPRKQCHNYSIGFPCTRRILYGKCPLVVDLLLIHTNEFMLVLQFIVCTLYQHIANWKLLMSDII